jgi:tRNA (adenine37-N6)-methyltransferase
MSNTIKINPIGEIRNKDGLVFIQLEETYRQALTNMEGFSHLQIIWWGHLTDNPSFRRTLVIEKLFRKAPEKLGVFATRSPLRPNPILISTVDVTGTDPEKGIIHIEGIDAAHETPVLDIKPYFKMERVRKCHVPEWCDHWPEWHEEVVGFNWKDEMDTR